MAAPLNRIGVIALRSTFRVRPRSIQHPQLYVRRGFRYTPLLRNQSSDPPKSTPQASAASEEVEADELEDEEISFENEPNLVPEKAHQSEDEPFRPADELLSFNMTPEEERMAEDFLANPPEEYREEIEQFRRQFDLVSDEVSKESEIETDAELLEDSMLNETVRNGLMSMGDEDDEEPFEDESFEGDDITSLAHGELEQHREIREYARIAAWDMPRLMKFAKPFELPTAEQPLRFRYTSYMGEEHPAQNKVVLEFCTADLPLKPAERLKMIKLLGVRYDPQKDLVKMSCESFDSQAQNKRYLGDLVEKLVATARGQGEDEAAKDSFEDVPVDFRHVNWNQPPKFPEEWKITPERQKLLDENRLAIAAAEQTRIDKKRIVDGEVTIKESYRTPMQPKFLAASKVRAEAQAPQQRRPELRIR